MKKPKKMLIGMFLFADLMLAFVLASPTVFGDGPVTTQKPKESSCTTCSKPKVTKKAKPVAKPKAVQKPKVTKKPVKPKVVEKKVPIIKKVPVVKKVEVPVVKKEIVKESTAVPIPSNTTNNNSNTNENTNTNNNSITLTQAAPAQAEKEVIPAQPGVATPAKSDVVTESAPSPTVLPASGVNEVALGGFLSIFATSLIFLKNKLFRKK